MQWEEIFSCVIGSMDEVIQCLAPDVYGGASMDDDNSSSAHPVAEPNEIQEEIIFRKLDGRMGGSLCVVFREMGPVRFRRMGALLAADGERCV